MRHEAYVWIVLKSTRLCFTFFFFFLEERFTIGVRLRSGISAFVCVAFLLALFQQCDEKCMNSIFNNKKYFTIVFSVINFQFSTK